MASVRPWGRIPSAAEVTRPAPAITYNESATKGLMDVSLKTYGLGWRVGYAFNSGQAPGTDRNAQPEGR